MTVPETTSAESLDLYLGGKLLRTGQGKAWREIRASTYSLPSTGGPLAIPSVCEPFLMWVSSGVAETQERENKGPWLTCRVEKGSFFLTTAGAPYDCRWKTLTAEPFKLMVVLIALPLMQRALEEVFGDDAIHAQMRDVSGFTDATLNSLVERLHEELIGQRESPLFVQGLAQAIAVHLARNYAELVKKPRSRSPSLPGYKLQQITGWMSDHLVEDLNLGRLAAQAGLSKFHFHRLFKTGVGVSPARYQVNLRMDIARRLLRETKKSVVEVAIEVGYANPSHFAQLFRRETGLCPTDYRRQR